MAVNDYIVTMLAADTPDWIVGAIFIAIMVIGAIANAVKDLWQKKDETKPESDKGSRPLQDQPSSRPAGQSPADELAARRRRQLQELARRRTGSQPQPPAQTGEPANLTSAQRAQRQRAKAEYERRAAELSAQRQAEAQRRTVDAPPRQARPTRPQTTPQQPPTPGQRQAPRQTVEQRHLQTGVRTLRSKRAIGAEPGSHNLGAGATQVDVSRGGHEGEPVHRHVPDVLAAPPRGPSMIAKMLGQKRSLQRAIVLKEILDRPIGLRDGSSSL